MTAVEWLWKIIGNMKTNPDDALLIVQSFNQAKAMEKEQILKALYFGKNINDDIEAEQYYNETYGSNTEI